MNLKASQSRSDIMGKKNFIPLKSAWIRPEREREKEYDSVEDSRDIFIGRYANILFHTDLRQVLNLFYRE